jgi:hypothetical protein
VAVRDAGTARVYNLTVAGAPEFYANGVLVHNCMDAERYAIAWAKAPEAVIDDQPTRIMA